MSILKNKYVVVILRIIVALLFIISGIEKISDLTSFSESIVNYRIIPFPFVNIIAITIPWIELFTGMFLLFGISIKENSFIINVLLVAFTLLVLQAFVRGLDIECGCYGTIDAQKVGLRKIGENILLIVFTSVVFLYDKYDFTLSKR